MFDFSVGAFVTTIVIFFGIPIFGIGIFVGWLIWG
jgi:hypothetical protein